MSRYTFRGFLFFVVLLLSVPPAVLGGPQQAGSVETEIPGKSRNGDAEPPLPNAEAIPPRHVIPGVPFIRWREAARWKFEDSEIANPSISAAFAMELEFWGEDRKALEQADYDLETSGFQVVGGNQDNQAWTITDIKRSLDRDVPVLVSLPLTPIAHPLYHTFEMLIMLQKGKGVELQNEGRPRSGALGRMVSLEDLHKIREQLNTNPMRESVHMASRLIIGYDDDRKVLLLHDPSFGPAFDLSYEDFDRMWASVDRAYTTVVPADASRQARSDRSPSAYRTRTSDEQAATHFVYGYALDCLGRLDDAGERFEEGLAVPGISKGYEFLLLFELALNRGERSDIPGAIEAAEKAAAVLAEHAFPWDFLSKLYTIRGDKGDRKKANEARKKAKALEADDDALKIVARAVPADFLILYLSGIRGWGADANP